VPSSGCAVCPETMRGDGVSLGGLLVRIVLERGPASYRLRVRHAQVEVRGVNRGVRGRIPPRLEARGAIVQRAAGLRPVSSLCLECSERRTLGGVGVQYPSSMPSLARYGGDDRCGKSRKFCRSFLRRIGVSEQMIGMRSVLIDPPSSHPAGLEVSRRTVRFLGAPLIFRPTRILHE